MGTDDRTGIGDEHNVIIVVYQCDTAKKSRAVIEVMALHTLAAAVVQGEFRKLGALAQTVFGNGEDGTRVVFFAGNSADHEIAVRKALTPRAPRPKGRASFSSK